MGISAAKTLVLSKSDSVVTEAATESTPEPVLTKGIKTTKMVVLSKHKKEVQEEKIDPVKVWRAEKPGKKSSFLQDMLAHNE